MLKIIPIYFRIISPSVVPCAQNTVDSFTWKKVKEKAEMFGENQISSGSNKLCVNADVKNAPRRRFWEILAQRLLKGVTWHVLSGAARAGVTLTRPRACDTWQRGGCAVGGGDGGESAWGLPLLSIVVKLLLFVSLIDSTNCTRKYFSRGCVWGGRNTLAVNQFQPQVLLLLNNLYL